MKLMNLSKMFNRLIRKKANFMMGSFLKKTQKSKLLSWNTLILINLSSKEFLLSTSKLIKNKLLKYFKVRISKEN